MTLRDIRYRRGGRSPQRGFDCSGFVHYVFAQVLGVDLPENSAAQYRDGRKIDRDELQAGDLVFFRTRGKRVSHVGIYVGEGRFIHSPTTGERVRVDRLSQQYWAHRFAGARRPDALI
jgi:cell wall-associated NlpC family hydrolase